MLTTYCRLCMAEEGLQSIDSFLLNAIRNEFAVEIRTNDELSQEICEQCSIFILKLLDFKKNVDIVQKLLQKTLKRNNNDCQVTGDYVPNNVVDVSAGEVNNESRLNLIDQKGNGVEENHYNQDNQENIDFIRKIIRSIDFNEITSLNTSTEITWKANGVYCEVCGVSLKQKFAFEKHLKSTSHAFKSYIAEKYGKLDIVRQYSCGYTCPCCQQVKTSKKELARHSKEAHGFTAQRTNLKPDTLVFKGGSPCSDARSRKIRPALVEVVDDNIKTEPLDVSAATSGGGGGGGEKVAGELVIQGDPRKYPCKFCSRSFCFVESFHKHLKKHHPEKHLCLQCGYVSRNRKLYAQHVRSHYNLTANQKVCSICFKICNDRVELHAHRKRVHDPIKKAFVCSLCKEMFVSIIELKQHKREVHFATPKNAAKSNFKCKKCNRTFVSELVLKIHQCTAKKFVCLKKCGKRFELYSKMERHMKRCTKGYTIYTCMYCKKKLSCLKTLKCHLTKCPLNIENKLIEKADISCTLCELQFQTETEFEKHYDKNHKSIPGSSRCEEATSRNVIDLATERNETSTSKNYWRCKKCRLKCLSLMELEQHFASCSGIKTKHVKCHCGAVFVDQKVLRLHNIVDHQVDKSVLITKKVSIESSSKMKRKSALSTSRTDATTNGKNSLAGKQSKQSKHQSPRSSQEVVDGNERTPAPAPPLPSDNDTVRKKNSSSGASVAGDNQEKNEYVAVPNNRTDSKDTSNTSSIRKPKRSLNSCTENTLPNADSKMPLPTACDKNEELIYQNISLNANDSASAGSRQNERNKNSSVFEPASTLARSVADIASANKFSHAMAKNEPSLESAKPINNSIIQTVACSHCGLVFNSKYFLQKHEFDAHKMLRDRVTADTNIESKRSRPISNNHLKQEHETADRNSPKFFERHNYRDSRYHSLAKTSSRSSRSLSESERFDDRYRWPTNRSSNRYENSPESPRNSSKITTPAKSLLKPDYLLNTGQITFTNSSSNSLSKGKNQLTITSNVNYAVCDVCKNPEPHLFCVTCRTCYRGNQVQYMNHMKMKHSS